NRPRPRSGIGVAASRPRIVDAPFAKLPLKIFRADPIGVSASKGAIREHAIARRWASGSRTCLRKARASRACYARTVGADGRLRCRSFDRRQSEAGPTGDIAL